MGNNYDSAIEQDGFAIIPKVISDEIISALLSELEKIQNSQAIVRRGQVTYGIRNLLSLSQPVRDLAKCDEVRSLVEPLLGREAFVARAIFFDKTPLTNWGVAWHQDLAIAVRHKIETEGFGPWSVKAGVPHTYAPAWVLERMLTIRLHLDDTLITNGALRVLPGSHLCGRFSNDEIDQWRRTREAVTCEIRKGGALGMRPLLLHSSLPSQQHQPGAHRRVIHLEFTSGQLPNGLEWACS